MKAIVRITSVVRKEYIALIGCMILYVCDLLVHGGINYLMHGDIKFVDWDRLQLVIDGVLSVVGYLMYIGILMYIGENE